MSYGNLEEPGKSHSDYLERLSELAGASIMMAQSLLGRHEIARYLAYELKTLFAVESAAILFTTDDRERIQLEASYTDRHGYDFVAFAPKIVGNTVGLTAHIAQTRQFFMQHDEELRNNPHNAGRTPLHLRSGVCMGLIGIPFTDRNGELLGLVNLENKISADGTAMRFDAADVFRARILQSFILPVFANVRISDAIGAILETIAEERSFEEISTLLLRKAIALVGAHRGELALWDTQRENLFIVAQIGEGVIKEGDTVPETSIARCCWANAEADFYNCPNVHLESDYFPVDPNTTTQLVVKLQGVGGPIGILSVESREHSFADYDLLILRRLSHYATIAVRTAGRQLGYQDFVGNLAVAASSSEQALGSILEAVRDVFRFDAGVIYIADNSRGLLKCAATIGCENVSDPFDFSYRFDERSFATETFMSDTPVFASDAATDDKISRRGRDHFNVRGPVLGVRIEHGSAKVGALVVWSRSASPPKRADGAQIQPFARLAASYIQTSRAVEQRSAVLKTIHLVSTQLRGNASLGDNLKHIAAGFMEVGFRGVRIFRLDAGANRFQVVAAKGGCEQLLGRQIDAHAFPYARDLCALAGPASAASILADSVVWSASQSLPDELSARPWAVVPLVTSDVCTGLIAVDAPEQFLSDSAARELVEYVNLLGALAAQAIAHEDEMSKRFRLWVQTAAKTGHMVSHGLTPIEGCLTLLEDRIPPLPDDALHLLAGAQDGVNDLKAIVERTISTEDIKADRELVDVALILREMCENLQRGHTRIRIQAVVPDHPVNIRLDRALLRVALHEFLANSLDAGATDFAVRCDEKPPNVCLIVSDNGKGVSEASRKTVFTPGVTGKGLLHFGVGLSIVAEFARLHNGEAELLDVDEGSSFAITLPSR